MPYITLFHKPLLDVMVVGFCLSELDAVMDCGLESEPLLESFSVSLTISLVFRIVILRIPMVGYCMQPCRNVGRWVVDSNKSDGRRERRERFEATRDVR